MQNRLEGNQGGGKFQWGFLLSQKGWHEDQQDKHCNGGSSVLAGWEVPGVSTK